MMMLTMMMHDGFLDLEYGEIDTLDHVCMQHMYIVQPEISKVIWYYVWHQAFEKETENI